MTKPIIVGTEAQELTLAVGSYSLKSNNSTQFIVAETQDDLNACWKTSYAEFNVTDGKSIWIQGTKPDTLIVLSDFFFGGSEGMEV